MMFISAMNNHTADEETALREYRGSIGCVVADAMVIRLIGKSAAP